MVAQRTLTSDLWAVTLEKSQGSKHDVVSILCHKHSTIKHFHRYGIIPSLDYHRKLVLSYRVLLLQLRSVSEYV